MACSLFCGFPIISSLITTIVSAARMGLVLSFIFCAIAFAFFVKGSIYENQENLYTALRNYFEALKNYDSTEQVNQKKLFIKIAGIYQRLNNDDKALEYYNAALKLIEKENRGNPLQNKSQTYLSIAGIYIASSI